MHKGNNSAIVLEDSSGLFIRSGTGKYRPSSVIKGIRKGSTVRAWPVGGGLKVELSAGNHTVWDKDLV